MNLKMILCSVIKLWKPTATRCDSHLTYEEMESSHYASRLIVPGCQLQKPRSRPPIGSPGLCTRLLIDSYTREQGWI